MAALATLTVEELAELKVSPEVAWYMQDRGIPLPEVWQAPLWKTPEPRELEEAFFDPERVDAVLAAFGELRHTQGRWAAQGRPLKPDPWQVAHFIAPVFGWVRWDDDVEDYVRVIRQCWIDVPRKNGKTTIAGGFGTYMLGADGEAGGQVIAAAAGKEQANFCFLPVKELITNSPTLKKFFRPYANVIMHKSTGSSFRAVSSSAALAHGANIHGAIVDEVHVHKTRDLIDAIETGTGARSQPLILYITTPDDGRPGSIYSEKRELIEKLARGVFTNYTVFGSIWGVAESEADMVKLKIDPFSEEAFKKANPGYGVSPSRTFLKAEADKAQQSPAFYATYLRLYLGLRTKQATRHIRLEDWDATAGMIDEDMLAGRACYGGLDLSSTQDVTAWCMVFPNRALDTVDVLWRFWIPEDRVADLDRRTAANATVWKEAGILRTTPGNVVDNAAIIKQILEDSKEFEILSIGFDRWGSNDVVKSLMDEDLTCVPISQGFATMTGPMREMQRLVLTKGLTHGGNPMMRWMIDNLAVAMDASDNIKPAKNLSSEKIDGVSALANALREKLDSDEVEYDIRESIG